MFLKAKLQDGSEVVSEFAKLGRVERYVTQVFQGYKPFNAWRVVGNTHPVSGEEVKTRTRVMLNGKSILSITQVEPTVEDHGYDPASFKLMEAPTKGEHGSYTVPEEGGPEGVEPGVVFPVHRDDSFRKYVILRVANPEAEAGTVESVENRHYLSAPAEEVTAPYASYGDEGEDEDEDENW
jgi:hypothetical protein